MTRKYHTVCVFEPATLAWHDEFGSYSKAEAQEECQMHKDDCKIAKVITHDDTAAAMMTTRDALEIPKRWQAAHAAAEAAAAAEAIKAALAVELNAVTIIVLEGDHSHVDVEATAEGCNVALRNKDGAVVPEYSAHFHGSSRTEALTYIVYLCHLYLCPAVVTARK